MARKGTTCDKVFWSNEKSLEDQHSLAYEPFLGLWVPGDTTDLPLPRRQENVLVKC